MTVRFGTFTLDTKTRRLTCGGEDLHLSPKAFDLLALLVERRPAVVDKATLREHLWPGVHVVDAGLSNLVIEIRAALKRASAAPLVRTVHSVGYAFDAEAAESTSAGPLAEASLGPPCWLVWKDRQLPLATGENLIGRDQGCRVWIDADDVSRRHARIHVPAGEPGAAVTIEDLDSTNGTSVQGRRIDAPTPLASGDRVKLGRVVVIFRSGMGGHAPTRRVVQPKRGR